MSSGPMPTAVTSASEERMRRFLATASHDLQSPLRHIAMYAEILLDELSETLDSEQRESLTAILQKAQTAQRLTKALMSFAAGTPQVSPAPVELGPIVDGLWTELKAEVGANDATFSHHTLPSLNSDAALLSTALKNILANALLYRGAATLHVELAAERSGSDWLIHISDNGRGIEPAHQERIFEPFWKLPQPDAVAGSGLGLTAARELLTALGGDLTLSHSDRTGSRFTIRLPAT
ncbi:ATP-binding protein [Rhizobium sullae]|uniref:histidine kinase n=1 Tax=Rhizobium sullae TaxID=50338 RepID=A0A2N0D3Z3_RHISU|nr:ATP-binding protein [Rhizobium sullae]PKA40840.1 two-component sensor histidine kinase [Rhizobium sullae]UWU14682.1 ATP-binding protein [Rhizobium sullae]